ncbi:hypothetical protein [Flavobacterium sp.]|uniref:hypothetical protein n=1 Tax=Flavobacterium sp. TaxID=239 RepID=UPI00286DEA1E|nr:hypothetical protein [Flavobacterium sp.]
MIKRIFIIESIPADEKLTGKELYYDIIVRYIKFFNLEIQSEYYFVNSTKEFLETLNILQKKISDEYETILHIEAHGGNEEIQFSNLETLKWTDLENCLIEINKLSKNNLHLNLATCYGMHVAEKISLIKTAPYKSFTSALKELSPLEIINDNSILYEEIIKTQNIFQGYINFIQKQKLTQLRIKDTKTALEYILTSQIMLFINSSPNFDLKSFFDQYLKIQIDKKILLNIKTPKEKIEYILNLFYERYFPK